MQPELELELEWAGFSRAGPLTWASKKKNFSRQQEWGGTLQAERTTQRGDDGAATWCLFSPLGWGPGHVAEKLLKT